MLMPIQSPFEAMLLDDHAFILDGISMTLAAHSDIRVVGRFTTTQALFGALRDHVPDVVLMDYCLQPGEIDGLNLVRALRIRHPRARVLVISAQHTPATVGLALRCGAAGFIGKELDPVELPDALRKVASGEIYVHPSVASRLAEGHLELAESELSYPSSPFLKPGVTAATLTVREHEVLRCCLDGFSVTDIAAKFSRSVKTISAQKQSAFRKLGVRNNNELFKIRTHLDEWK
ncbi:response regulator transcription factor [Pseudomonas sp. dw_358]|uniref:response regulator transcription factor n=1 Tax=Pseudomonas sp. dw_358 TaxID=2720083 RepID=UPI0021164902|nr:response regulator transcription factor [Pseudomonas sp. dw_358]